MIEISKKLCIGCGKCVDDCISMSLYLHKEKAIYTGNCIHCGHCVAICPTNAVSMPEYDMDDVEEINGIKKSFDIETLLSVIKSRRSIRHYKTKKVEAEKIENILQAGRYTATAVNRQACKFIVVQDNIDYLKKLVWDGLENAISKDIEEAQPLQRLLSLKKEKQIDYLFRNSPSVVYIAAENLWDAGLAAQNMELAAVSQGLGIMYNGYLVRSTKLSEKAKEWLQTDGKPIVISMLLGYPDIKYMRTAPRKTVDSVLL